MVAGLRTPLVRMVSAIDALNKWIGESVSWLTLFMVLVTFAVVILRYAFNLGWVWLQESVLYAHGIVFLMAAGYGLLMNAHVRIDIFYRGASPRQKAWINILGTLFLLFPTCGVILKSAWFFVWDAWTVFEGSKDVGGIEAVFLLKTTLLIFCFLLILQGLSLIGRSVLVLWDPHDA